MPARTVFCQLFVVLTIVTASSYASYAKEWPQWLGEDRNGVWQETDLVSSFAEKGPSIVWRAEVGAGYSGPSVAGNRVLLMDRQLANPDAEPKQQIAAIEGSERVLCLDASTGKQLWKHEYDCQYKISYPNGPRTTPTVDGEFVYCLGAMGRLTCLRLDDGGEVWSCEFMERFEMDKPLAWGWAASPLVDGDQLICLVGGKDAGVVAFNKKTGETLWQSLNVEEVGYASPVLFEQDRRRQLLVWYDVGLASLDPATGERLWDVTFPEDGPVMRPAVTISHPRVFGNHVLVSDFYHGSTVVKISSNPPEGEILWTTAKGTGTNKESLNTLMAAPVVRDGHVYGFAGNGELRCAKTDTGEIVWHKFGPNGKKPAMFATTFIVPAADHSFLYNDQGELIIAKLSPAGYEELDRAKILETTSFARGRDIVWSHPAFAHRCMFARNDKEIVCVNLAKES